MLSEVNVVVIARSVQPPTQLRRVSMPSQLQNGVQCRSRRTRAGRKSAAQEIPAFTLIRADGSLRMREAPKPAPRPDWYAIGQGKGEVDLLHGKAEMLDERSEERRVGKECRSRWSPEQ